MSANIERAIEIVKRSRQTHVEWHDYIRDYPDLAQQPRAEVDTAGDLEHHKSCIADYDHVLAVLREIEG